MATPQNRMWGALLALCLGLPSPLGTETSETTNQERLAIRLENTGIVINDTGTLQQAVSLFGPCKEISRDASPYKVPTSEAQSYYRSLDTSAIFTSESILSPTLRKMK